MSLINQSRKTLFNEKIPWVKKDNSEDFDVPMGCFDKAEVCELVGTFILNKSKNVFQNNTFGLYRDDGLAVTKGLSGPEIERLKKNVKTFKDCGLNITIEVYLHTVNYLDVTFNLRKGTYLPYRKPDNSSKLYLYYSQMLLILSYHSAYKSPSVYQNIPLQHLD